MPHPLNISGDISCSATAAALSASTIPLHRQCPMLDAQASTGRLSRSSANGVAPAVGQPEALVERSLQGGGARATTARPRPPRPELARPARPAPGTRRTRSPAPRTARSAARRAAVGEIDPVPRVLPPELRVGRSGARPGVAEGDLLIECLGLAGDRARSLPPDRRIEQPINVDLKDSAAGHQSGGTGVSVPPRRRARRGPRRAEPLLHPCDRSGVHQGGVRRPR